MLVIFLDAFLKIRRKVRILLLGFWFLITIYLVLQYTFGDNSDAYWLRIGDNKFSVREAKKIFYYNSLFVVLLSFRRAWKDGESKYFIVLVDGMYRHEFANVSPKRISYDSDSSFSVGNDWDQKLKQSGASSSMRLSEL